MESKDFITIVISALGLISGLIGMVIGVLSYLHNRSLAVNTYFEQDANVRLSDARHFIYNLSEDECITNDHSVKETGMVGAIVSFYDHWGLMIVRKQLPLWVFYCRKDGLTASGYSVIRLYRKLKPTIAYRRHQNYRYAFYFERLSNILLKKVGESITMYGDL